jgi:hypothetical protein
VRLHEVNDVKQLLLIGVLALPACSVFQSADTTAALEADMQRERLHVSIAEAFRDVVQRAQGWSDEDRQRVLDTIDQNVGDYAALAQRSHVFLEQVGSVDWRAIAQQVVELYRELRVEG